MSLMDRVLPEQSESPTVEVSLFSTLTIGR